MMCGYGVGDNHLFVIDFPLCSMIGHTPTKIVWPSACCLNMHLPHVLKKYNAKLDAALFMQHHMLDHLRDIASLPDDGKEVAQSAIN